MPKAKPDPSPDDLIVSMPLSAMVISPMNARATEPTPEDIATLAASIEACGLMQNLLGYIDPNSKGDVVEIVAGGRRLRALQLLASQPGKLLRAADPFVPVQITYDRNMAIAWAAAENTGRTALHPADEIQAYRRMRLSGSDANAIARAFAVTERHVRQRLKLALLPDPVVAALRTGKLSLDQAEAFTLARTEDHAAEVLQKVLTSQWGNKPTDIRAMLSSGTVRGNDRRALFVGVEAYEAEGGEVERDLFTDGVFFLDEALLDKLFSTRLAAAVEAERQTGWAWVKVFENYYPDYNVNTGMQRLLRTPVDLPEGDLDELDELTRLGEQDELTDAQIDRMDELQTRAAGDYRPEDIARAGIWLYVDQKGSLCTYGPFIAPSAKTEDGLDQSGGTVTTVEPKALSQSLLDDLAAVKLAALQRELASTHGLAHDLLAYQLAHNFRWDAPIEVSFSRQRITTEKPEGYDLPAGLTTLDDNPAAHDTPSIEGFQSFRAKGSVERDGILALVIARSLKRQNTLAPWLADLLQPQPRRMWTPTGPGYFTRLPAGHLDAIWSQLVPDDRTPDHATFKALKKADKAKHLHRLFNEADFCEAVGLSRKEQEAIATWLPAEMLWPALEAAPVARAAE